MLNALTDLSIIVALVFLYRYIKAVDERKQ